MPSSCGKILLLAAAALLLPGCGGGGGDATATPASVGYTGPTGAASFSGQATTDGIIGKTVSSAMSLDLGSTTSDLMAYKGAVQGAPSGLSDLTLGLIDRALSLSGNRHTGKLLGVTESRSYDCIDGGTITLTANVADPNATTPSPGDSFTLAASNCNEGGRILTGGFSFAIISYSGGSNLIVSVTFSRMKSTVTGGDYELINGGFTMAYRSNTSSEITTISGNALLVEQGRSGTIEQHALLNFSLVDTMDASGNFTADHDYTFYSTDIDGFVTVTTTTPFFIAANATYPSAGVMVISGASGASVRLSAQADATNIFIEYDIDPVDGSYESSQTLTWSSLASL